MNVILPVDTAPMLDPRGLRAQFPIFAHNPDLVFLDTAASSQKPDCVIDGIADFYRRDYANVHRGVYDLSVRATERYDQARRRVRRFINAGRDEEIVFVRGATEAINLVAQTWGAATLKAGDRILITDFEHHANIVPWQLLRDRIGLEILVAPMAADGSLDMGAFKALLDERVKLVAITQVANVTGYVLPVAEIIELGHGVGARVLVDGCQAVPRMPVDVTVLGCDFYAFSGHKCYGPTGIGVLYGKAELLAAMPPWQGGGDMILSVTHEKTLFQDAPLRFEAGTPDIAGAVGLDLALDFLANLGMEAVLEHETALTAHARERLAEVPGVDLVPAGGAGVGVVSFTVKGIHPHDLATIFSASNVAIRAGHHCAQPLMTRLGLPATARASFGIYSDDSDVDALVKAVVAARQLFGWGA